MRHRITHRVVPQSESPRAAVLRDLLAQAEASHALLLRLMPAMRDVDEWRFAVVSPSGEVSEVTFTVRERGPFTTLLDIVESRATDGWVMPMRASVRLSHDARVAEVVEFHRQRRLQARYPYPNPGMLQPDEKLQVNRLLGEWLQHCLRWGRSCDRLPCPA
jgi:uncharacterized protein YqiB (DUF1249 family)